MDRGPAAPRIRVIEAGQVVVDQGCAVQQFYRSRRRRGQHGGIAGVGQRDREAEFGADPRPAGKHRVGQGRGQLRGTVGLRRLVDHRTQNAFKVALYNIKTTL